MDYSIFLMVIGLLLIIGSFFIKDGVRKIENEMEDISFSLYQETSAIKRRLKIIEEELLMEDTNLSVQTKQPNKPAIHDIIKSQVLELHKQGFSFSEISKRSSLSIEEVKYVIGGGK